VLTTAALIIGLVAVNLLQPGVGMNVDLSKIDTSAVSGYVAQSHKQDLPASTSSRTVSSARSSGAMSCKSCSSPSSAA
jgi:Na+/H+-dicarboxylate symporter